MAACAARVAARTGALGGAARRACAAAACTRPPIDRAHRVGLGVPLHAEHEAPLGQLDRLGELVERRVRADAQPVAEAIDALVVVGLGARAARSPITRIASEPVARASTSWSAPSKEPSTRRCSLVAEVLGQVLDRASRRARR